MPVATSTIDFARWFMSRGRFGAAFFFIVKSCHVSAERTMPHSAGGVRPCLPMALGRAVHLTLDRPDFRAFGYVVNDQRVVRLVPLHAILSDLARHL